MKDAIKTAGQISTVAPIASHRARRGVLLFALFGLLALCASMNLEIKPEPPSIEIRGVKYQPIEYFDTHPWRATFALTNSGISPFEIEISMADFLRVETDKGWITETNWPSKYARSVIGFDWQRLLRRGEGAESEVELPANTRRWQAGYHVRAISPRKNLEMKFGPKISKPIVALFGDWISDQDGIAVVWGPVIEMINGTNSHSDLFPPIR